MFNLTGKSICAACTAYPRVLEFLFRLVAVPFLLGFLAYVIVGVFKENSYVCTVAAVGTFIVASAVVWGLDIYKWTNICADQKC
jgi:hypothetical membrane protein